MEKGGRPLTSPWTPDDADALRRRMLLKVLSVGITSSSLPSSGSSASADSASFLRDQNLPAWAPNSGHVANISYAKGAHPNGRFGGAVMSEIDPRHQTWNPLSPAQGPYGGLEGSYYFNSIHAYCGAVFNPTTRQIVGYGAGHSAINIGAVWAFDLQDLAWKWLDSPLPTDGLSLPRVHGSNVPIPRNVMERYYPPEQYDFEWGDWNGGWSGWPAGYGQPGKRFPEPGHSRSALCFIPGHAYGNQSGAMLKLAASTGSNGGTYATGTHLFDFDSRQWIRTKNRPTATGGSTVFDSMTSKTYSVGQDGASGYVNAIKVFDVKSQSWEPNKTTHGGPYMNFSAGGGGLNIHPPSRLALISCPQDALGNPLHPIKFGIFATAIDAMLANHFSWIALSVAADSWPVGSDGFMWTPEWALCPINNCFYTINGVNDSHTLWKLSPPVYARTQAEHLGGVWTLKAETLSGVPLYSRDQAGQIGDSYVYKKLSWDTKSRSFLWFSNWYEGPVQAIRPLGL